MTIGTKSGGHPSSPGHDLPPPPWPQADTASDALSTANAKKRDGRTKYLASEGGERERPFVHLS
jgi:hypothetical protein